MQLAECVVRIAGDIQNTVKKYKVTPAEMLVLRRLHGDDAVVETKITGSKKISNKEELDRIKEIYVDRFGSSNPDRPNVVKELFPGASPNLPQEFSEIMPAEHIKEMDQPAETAKKPSTLQLNPGNNNSNAAA